MESLDLGAPNLHNVTSVSYTHLDVYKRQVGELNPETVSNMSISYNCRC